MEYRKLGKTDLKLSTITYGGQLKEAEQSISLASNQIPYSMLNRGIEADIVPYTIENSIGLIAYSPLERGLLTGKYFKEATLKANDHRNDYFNQFDPEKVKSFLKSIEPLANYKDVSLAQLVLRWTTLQPGITIVLAGARNAEQAISNAQAINIHINADELIFIKEHLSNL